MPMGDWVDLRLPSVIMRLGMRSPLLAELSVLFGLFLAVHLLVILPYCRQHCPYSLYFSVPTGDLLAKVHRAQEAATLAADLFWIDTPPNGARSEPWDKPFLSVVVVTSKRKDVDYLKRSVASVEQRFAQINHQVVVCNADMNYQFHEAAENLSQWTRTFRVYEEESRTVFRHQFTKENLDYLKCLNHTHAMTRPEYILVVEDDMVALPDASQRLLNLCNQQPREWDILKLSYSLQYQGFELTRHGIAELCLASILFTGVTFLLMAYLRPHRRTPTHKLALVVFIFGGTLLSLRILGHQHSLGALYKRLFPDALVTFTSGSSGALLYSSHVIPAVIEYLVEHLDAEAIPTDFILNQFLTEHPWVRPFRIQRDMFAHIGFTSTFSGRIRDPRHFFYHA